MRHPLPYAFARASQLLLEDDGHALTLWHHGQPDLSALGEVMRKYALSEPALTLERLDAAALAQRISSAYAKGESSAAAVVSEVESGRRPHAHDAGAACRRRPAGEQPTTRPSSACSTRC
jgi:general secretion pathway protein E